MDLYFAYGSNMSTPRLQARVGDARPLHRACVEGWQLCFDKPGRDGTAKANLVPVPEARAWGVLFEIPAAAWDVLDGFERGYERRRLRLADRAGAALHAQAYVYRPAAQSPAPTPPASRDAPRRTGRPSAAYLEHLLAGAREHGLPQRHVAWIASFAR